jgi:hypothetical protein
MRLAEAPFMAVLAVSCVTTMQSSFPREERKNQAVIGLFAKLEAVNKDAKPAALATK